MLTRSRIPAAAVTALLLTAGLAGCASATPDASQVQTRTTIDPLGDYLAVDWSDGDNGFRKKEEVISQCTKAQGFDYTMIEPTRTADGDQSDLSSPPREWTAQHGYGMVESAFPAAKDAAEPDANTAYVDTLSPAQQVAYNTAMVGKNDGREGGADASWEDKGCAGKADHEVVPDGGTQPPIIAEASDYRNTLQSDPKFDAIISDWSDCMSSAGYPDDPHWGFGGPFDEKVTAFLEKHPDATPDDPAVVKLKAEEITHALADWDCADKVDFDGRYWSTLGDLEKDYIAEHKGELEEAKLWLNQ